MGIDFDQISHIQNLQLQGIIVPGLDPFYDAKGRTLFRLFRLIISTPDTPFDPVPIKLPAVPAGMSPYSFISDELFYNGEKLDLGIQLRRAPIPPEESKLHYRGYTFPFGGTNNPYRELRLNPRITGCCPGRCFFCHRVHSHRVKPEEKYLFTPAELINHIQSDEGRDIFEDVQRVLIITELFGREDYFLDTICETSQELAQVGYPEEKEFGCIAQDVRSNQGHRILNNLVRPSRYSFSLEFFENRNKLMGPYKGILMDEVLTILESARQAGFEEIQLNYLAGIDSLEASFQGFNRLVDLNLVDSVGFSTYTFFSEEQRSYRHETAWDPKYYLELVTFLSDLGVRVYHPEAFDMGSPYTILMEKTLL